jgi:hypothetical protein
MLVWNYPEGIRKDDVPNRGGVAGILPGSHAFIRFL